MERPPQSRGRHGQTRAAHHHPEPDACSGQSCQWGCLLIFQPKRRGVQPLTFPAWQTHCRLCVLLRNLFQAKSTPGPLSSQVPSQRRTDARLDVRLRVRVYWASGPSLSSEKLNWRVHSFHQRGQTGASSSLTLPEGAPARRTNVGGQTMAIGRHPCLLALVTCLCWLAAAQPGHVFRLTHEDRSRIRVSDLNTSNRVPGLRNPCYSVQGMLFCIPAIQIVGMGECSSGAPQCLHPLTTICFVSYTQASQAHPLCFTFLRSVAGFAA